MKKTASWLLKACIAGLIAFVFLTGFCFFYYNVPVHDDELSGVTDFAYEHNKFYSRALEGFSWGRTNNEGYINAFDYTEGQNVDILVMGSSHMEAFQVPMYEATASLLSNLFPEDTVYNISLSGHNFLICADNFSAAMEKYKPTKYVLLEIQELTYSDEGLTSAINETVADISSHADGLFGLLQKNPLLKKLYATWHATLPKTFAEKVWGSEALYDELLAKLSNTAAQTGAQLIILHHPHLLLNQDGSASVEGDEEQAAIFADLCRKNNILFLDMTNIFLQRYEKDHILPHGFFNSSIGTGHLNKYGHEMVANAVYELMKEGE